MGLRLGYACLLLSVSLVPRLAARDSSAPFMITTENDKLHIRNENGSPILFNDVDNASELTMLQDKLDAAAERIVSLEGAYRFVYALGGRCPVLWEASSDIPACIAEAPSSYGCGNDVFIHRFNASSNVTSLRASVQAYAIGPGHERYDSDKPHGFQLVLNDVVLWNWVISVEASCAEDVSGQGAFCESASQCSNSDVCYMPLFTNNTASMTLDTPAAGDLALRVCAELNANTAFAVYDVSW